MKKEEKGMTSRAKQALETKNRILNEGRKLISKKGYNAVTVEEICKSSNITVGTYYYYFKGKDELVVDLFPKLEDFKKISKFDEECSSYQKIVEYFSFFNSQLERNVAPEVVRELFNSARALEELEEERVIHGIEYIIEGQLKGEIDKEILPGYMSKMIFAATRGVTLHWSMHQSSLGLTETTVDLVERIVYSFLTEEGKKKAKDYMEKE